MVAEASAESSAAVGLRVERQQPCEALEAVVRAGRTARAGERAPPQCARSTAAAARARLIAEGAVEAFGNVYVGMDVGAAVRL